MHELEVLLSRLKMEHLSYHVESLLEQAAKKELNYREFLCMALQQEWNGRHQRGMESRLKQARLPWVKTLEQFDFTSSRASTVRLSGNWLVWRSWSAAKT
ncbi:Putative transposase [Escherichia coli]|uniref:Transposase n=1 Tax=Escherichia coli TaxID=562 RepID=A0A376MP13_ECOLX|nr:Putative transposase [Escherichia coli]